MQKVFLKIDDIDQHGIGCPCGECKSNGKSYGAAMFDVTEWNIEPGEDIPEELLDAVRDDECSDRFYGPSEDAALYNAREYVRKCGWTLYE